MKSTHKPHTPPTADNAAQGDEHEFNVANAVDDLHQLIAKADAMAHAAESLFNESVGGDDVDDRRDLERLAHLIGGAAEAVQTALEASGKLAAGLSARRMGA